MKPVDQTIATPPKGDCFRACLASILELPIEECPNPPSDPDGHFWNEWIAWLRPRGLELIQWEVPEDRDEGQRVCGVLAGYWIATVPSLNCPPNPERPNLGRHCIVMRGEEIAHDPSTGEKREGFNGDDRIFEVTLLHPLNPAQTADTPANYGPRHVIQDSYGQDVQVDVEMGDGSVCLHWGEDEGAHPASSRVRRTHVASSSLTPDRTRKLAKQLEAAAEEAERYAG